jgi:hypothetical protein
MKDQEDRPSGRTPDESEFPFLVWQQQSKPAPWKCIAAFRFFTDCENFVKGIAEKGEECLYQTPLRSKLIKPKRVKA